METTWTTLEGSSLVLKVVERVQEKKEFKLRQQISLDEHILSPPITHDCDYWEGKCEDLFANASTRKWLMAGTLRLLDLCHPRFSKKMLIVALSRARSRERVWLGE